MQHKTNMEIEFYLKSLIVVNLIVFLSPSCADAAAPVFNPTTYQITVGTNTTTGTVLATLVYTDPEGQAVTLSVDDSGTGGGSYFSLSNNDLVLSNRLDVEFGEIAWTVNVLAVDTEPTTGTATISIKTYQSTTTTSTTPAPPGYDWFDSRDNVIVFGVTCAVTAIIMGFCILMCWRFHRVGTCLPKRCPEYGQCRDSFNRQCHCCPIPCNYYYKKKIITEPLQMNLVTPDAKPLPPPLKTNFYVETQPENMETTFQEEGIERVHVVTPVLVGNVDLRDVGFDGMRSPGFNAPMFTSYGGARDHPPPNKPGPRGRGGRFTGVPRRKR